MPLAGTHHIAVVGVAVEQVEQVAQIARTVAECEVVPARVVDAQCVELVEIAAMGFVVF